MHIGYYDEYNGVLKYVTNVTGSWKTKTLDTSGETGKFTSIALDQSGKVHISYTEHVDTDSDYLKYATNASGSWVTTTVVDSGMSINSSIAISSKGKVHICYSEDYNGALHYATNTNGDWGTDVVGLGAGRTSKYGLGKSNSADLALDTSGKVHICYGLHYATNAFQQTVTPSPTCSSDGDVNEDGKLTAGDALLAFKSVLGSTTLTSCQESHADVNGNGKVTAADALCIFKAVLKGESLSESISCE